MEQKKKFVVLERLNGINKGQRFWTTNCAEDSKYSEDNSLFKEVLFTDSPEEAIKKCESRL